MRKKSENACTIQMQRRAMSMAIVNYSKVFNLISLHKYLNHISIEITQIYQNTSIYNPHKYKESKNSPVAIS